MIHHQQKWKKGRHGAQHGRRRHGGGRWQREDNSFHPGYGEYVVLTAPGEREITVSSADNTAEGAVAGFDTARCPLCRKGCSLAQPGCMRGEAYAASQNR